jgi:hypothetical protein
MNFSFDKVSWKRFSWKHDFTPDSFLCRCCDNIFYISSSNADGKMLSTFNKVGWYYLNQWTRRYMEVYCEMCFPFRESPHICECKIQLCTVCVKQLDSTIEKYCKTCHRYYCIDCFYNYTKHSKMYHV